MRMAFVAAAAAAMCSGSVSMAAAADYYLKIEAVAAWSGSGPIYLKVRSSGDLDGDGAVDQGVLRLHCTGGFLRSASFRDSKDGAAWAPPSAELAQKHRLGYELKGGRGGEGAGWAPIRLSNTHGLCPDAMTAVAKVKATKPRSNIQNN